MKIKIKEYLISRVAKLLGFPHEVADYINSCLSVGYSSGEPMPKVLLDFNIVNIVRGVFTRFIVSTNLDWIWPFWMERQFYAKYNDFSARGFQPASINTSHRNWTMIGTLDSEHEAIVDPRGLLTPTNDWSLDTWIQYNEKVYSPASLDDVKQDLHQNLPIVKTEYTVEKALQVTLTNFVGEAGIPDVALLKAEIKNISDKVIENDYFAFAVRPYSPEGISLIKNIQFKESGEIFVNKKLAAVLMEMPSGVLTSHLSKGDCKHYFDEAKNNKIHAEGSSRVGMATGIAVHRLYLKPGESVSYEIRLPIDDKKIKKWRDNGKAKQAAQQIKKNKFNKLLQQELEKWQAKLTEGLRLELPDKTLQAAFLANKAYMLLFYDGDYITPGPTTYHAFWFRDASYLINALDKLGFHKETEKILATYKRRQLASGFFLSQRGEWDSNGQAIWTMVEHYRLTRNKQFLSDNYNCIVRGARWIDYKRRSNLKLDIGYRGLMPPGLSAEHFGLDDFYYWDDFWSLAGLRDACLASTVLEKKTPNFEKAYKQLEFSIDLSLEYVESRLGRPIMPISPSRRMDSAAIGCLSAYYPTRLYNPNNVRLANTIDFLQDKCFIKGGFFHDVNHAGYGTYLTTHIAQCYLGQRSQKAIDILNWLMSVSSPTFTWPEAIHPRTLGGTIGDGHHGWAAADFLLLIRNILYMEENNGLVITPVIPKAWVKKDNKICVNQAATYFGALNYVINFISEEEIVLQLKPDFAVEPEYIEWCLPKKITKAAADNKQEIKIEGNKITFSPKVKEVKVFL